jgi:AbrB family looped-hinge helix DNA binding protein
MNANSEIAKISSRGQVVIPAQVRKQAGISKGEQVLFFFDEQLNEIRIRKVESIDAFADRFTSYIKPGTTPLEITSDVYRARDPRI